jgi:hypothetical protein
MLSRKKKKVMPKLLVSHIVQFWLGTQIWPLVWDGKKTLPFPHQGTCEESTKFTSPAMTRRQSPLCQCCSSTSTITITQNNQTLHLFTCQSRASWVHRLSWGELGLLPVTSLSIAGEVYKEQAEYQDAFHWYLHQREISSSYLWKPVVSFHIWYTLSCNIERAITVHTLIWLSIF